MSVSLERPLLVVFMFYRWQMDNAHGIWDGNTGCVSVCVSVRLVSLAVLGAGSVGLAICANRVDLVSAASSAVVFASCAFGPVLRAAPEYCIHHFTLTHNIKDKKFNT